MDTNDQTLNVCETFLSIDGEVNGFGRMKPSFFIRLAGCNLKCKWCFGIRPGRRIPRIATAIGPNKKLNEVKIGDMLMTYDSDHNLVETEVVDVLTREVDRWLRIKIDEVVYFVTEEHPFFTTHGLMPASNLVVGDMILHASPDDKVSFSKLGDRNPMKRPDVAAKSTENTDYTSVGKKISTTIRRKQQLGIYNHPWVNMSEDRKAEIRKQFSARMKGDKNPNWNGGSKTPNFDILSELCTAGVINVCTICNNETRVIPHHIDEDPKNDSLANIQIACHPCHNKIHKRGYNFWRGERKDGKVLSAEKQLQMLQSNGVEVQEIKLFDRKDFLPSIKPKPLKVYNLTCTPYNTYLIDYMWVHNCDSEYAREIGSGEDMTVAQILTKIKDAGNPPKITITGGEPLLQDRAQALTRTLLDFGYYVSVETNGSIDIADYSLRYRDNHISFVIDYKLDQPDKMVPDNFVNATERDWVKFVIDTDSDFEQAADLVRAFTRLRSQTSFAFSPTVWPGDHNVSDRSAWLVDKILAAQLWNVALNVQFHKIIWPGRQRGV
ncbi:hypothetical protein LCGC14_0569360 [marine sediment metagenome]|uniref:Uncharacterized protein n=1 Tax=marine sediment metagenome TaxID=412755 RepID=A0A0F9S376_9ZZZZ